MTLTLEPAETAGAERVVRPPRTRTRPGRGSVLAWAPAALFFTLYAALAVRDQQRMLTTGFDLGIFDEGVRAYAHGHLPVVPLKGFDLLGDHFSPIWAVLAPFYLLWPSAYLLLLAQAALLAVAVVPLVRWAEAAAGTAAAVVVGVGYGASWGIASAAGFDVHEVAFAVPLLAFSAAALGRRRLRAAAAWALPLLLVKEDMGLTVAAVGLLIACRGARRLGATVAAAGLLGTVLEIRILIPLANPAGGYGYAQPVQCLTDVLRGHLAQAVVTLITPEIKMLTVLLMLAPTAFLALRSPLLWLAVPTLFWRFASDNPAYWGTGDHYSAVLMPVVFAAFVDALARYRATPHREATRTIRTALAACVAVTLALLPDFPLGRLAEAATWRTSPRVAAAHQIMGLIPDGATVAASDQLVPQLSDRTAAMLFDTSTPQRRPAWVLVDTGQPDEFPLTGGQEAGVLARLRAEGYRTVADRDGYSLLREP